MQTLGPQHLLQSELEEKYLEDLLECASAVRVCCSTHHECRSAGLRRETPEIKIMADTIQIIRGHAQFMPIFGSERSIR